MKVMTILAVLAVTMSTSFGAQKREKNDVLRAKEFFVAGTFLKGKTYNGTCTVSIDFKKTAKEGDVLVATMTSTTKKGVGVAEIVISSKQHEVELNITDNDPNNNYATLSKSREVPEPDNEGAFLTIIESVSQDITDGKVTEIKMEWMEVNEHSDPSEDNITCSF